jgi:hypothetical protein
MVHLSKDISAEHAEQLSTEIAKRFMSADDYFDLKQFSYFKRGYGIQDFRNDLRISDHALLPFSVIPALAGE